MGLLRQDLARPSACFRVYLMQGEISEKVEARTPELYSPDHNGPQELVLVNIVVLKWHVQSRVSG
jgi:hypothetical protein